MKNYFLNYRDSKVTVNNYRLIECKDSTLADIAKAYNEQHKGTLSAAINNNQLLTIANFGVDMTIMFPEMTDIFKPSI